MNEREVNALAQHLFKTGGAPSKERLAAEQTVLNIMKGLRGGQELPGAIAIQTVYVDLLRKALRTRA